MQLTPEQLTAKKRAKNGLADDPAMPALTPGELEVLKRHLAAAKNYLEFGCGGSTRVATLMPNIQKIWSVESDAQWITTLEKEFEPGRVQFRRAEIGPTGAWGKPIDESLRSSWSRYHSDIWNELDPTALDLVLIDGRFRIACALQAGLHVTRNCTIIFDDFWSRNRNLRLLPVFDLKERVDSMAVFQVKEPKPVQQMLAMLKRHAFNWR